MKNAFTLAEMLVVISLLALTGLIMTEVFVRTLRGSSKAQVISTIKQNGQSALSTMDKTIRNSTQVVETCNSDSDPNMDTIIVVDNQHVYTRFRFNLPFPSNNPTSNGYITQEIIDPTLTHCIDPLTSNPSNLTDTNSQTGVSLRPGAQFTWSSQSVYKDSVTIDFYLEPGVSTAKLIKDALDPVEFKTTVGLR